MPILPYFLRIGRQRRLPHSAGFTLLELLVVMAIMMFLLGGGLAMYIQLNNRQLLVDSARQLQLLMRTAQKQARVGSKPTGCTRLLGYEVQAPTGLSPFVNLIAVCANTTYTVQTLTFDSGVVTRNAFQVYFYVLQGGVGGPGDFVLKRNGKIATFTVNQGGEITDITYATGN